MARSKKRRKDPSYPTIPTYIPPTERSKSERLNRKSSWANG